MGDYYIDTALKHLREVCRILNMKAPEYYKEVVEKNPIYEKTLKVDDMWAFRTGAVKSEVEIALQLLERRETADEV